MLPKNCIILCYTQIQILKLLFQTVANRLQNIGAGLVSIQKRGANFTVMLYTRISLKVLKNALLFMFCKVRLGMNLILKATKIIITRYIFKMFDFHFKF